ncbi:MAG: type II secretion system F family protein [Pirellulales bacterium]
MTSSWQQNPNSPPAPPRLSPAEAAQLGDELTRLAAAGLPLPEGLRALADEAPTRKLRRGLLSLAARLERGEPLAEALAHLGRRLPGYLSALLASPAAQHRLGALLSAQLEEERRAKQLRFEARTAALYPGLIVACSIVVFSFLVLMLARPVTSIMYEFGLELPWPTQLLVNLQENSTAVAVSVLGTVAGGWLLVRFVLPRPLSHAALKLVPFVGPLWRFSALARWSRMVAQLLDAEVPLPQAISLAGESTGDADLAAASRQAAQSLAQGQPLAQALGMSTAFPRSLGPMLNWSSNQHQLTTVLLAAGDSFAVRARRQINLIGIAMPAIAFLVVVWCASFLYSAAFGPLRMLFNNLI